MKEAKFTEYDIVKRQLEHLYIVQEKIPIINDFNVTKIGSSEIGERTSKFTHSNYHEVYKTMLEEEKFNILINDESMISLYYMFNESGNIVQHNLSYIPSIDIEIYLSEDISLEDQILISRNANNYIRIDYDRTGKKEIVHTDIHMHFGIYPKEKNLASSEFRIPMEGILFPYEFIYIIFKYLYGIDDEYVSFLIVEKYSKSTCLEINECDKLVLSFGRENYTL